MPYEVPRDCGPAGCRLEGSRARRDAIVPYAFASPPGLVAPFDSRMCYAPWSVFQDGSDMDPKQAMPQTAEALTRLPRAEARGCVKAGSKNPGAFSIPSGRRRGHGNGSGPHCWHFTSEAPDTRTPGYPDRPRDRHPTSRDILLRQRVHPHHTEPMFAPAGREPGDATDRPGGRPHAGETP